MIYEKIDAPKGEMFIKLNWLSIKHIISNHTIKLIFNLKCSTALDYSQNSVETNDLCKRHQNNVKL